MSVALQISGASRHNVRVEINGINRVGDGNFAVERENFLNVAAVAFGAVADKNFVRFNVKPATFVIVIGNFLAQERISLFRAVAAKSFSVAHFISSTFHRVNAHLRQWTSHVADAEPNDFRVGIFRLELRGTFADFREQITAGQFQIIFVDLRHLNNSSYNHFDLQLTSRNVQKSYQHCARKICSRNTRQFLLR